MSYAKLEKLLDALRADKAFLVAMLDKLEPDNRTEQVKLTVVKTYLDCTIAEVRSMLPAYKV